jgi:hypothetical protein
MRFYPMIPSPLKYDRFRHRLHEDREGLLTDGTENLRAFKVSTFALVPCPDNGLRVTSRRVPAPVGAGRARRLLARGLSSRRLAGQRPRRGPCNRRDRAAVWCMRLLDAAPISAQRTWILLPILA